MTTTQTFSSRFTRPVFLWAVAAALTEILVTWLVVHGHVPRALALLPVLPYMIFFAAMVRSVLKMDEMQKRICLESASIAFLLTLIITVFFVGVEQAGLGRPPWEEVGGFMLLLWACAYGLSAWRYR
jgi:dipeptide/tripeptide permease